jgi:gluconokinase
MDINGFIIMGVSGCGKSTVARQLAEKLDWDFFDADNFHPPGNIAKMKSGIPLSDSDRAPWLSALNEMLISSLRAGRHPVLACSALKKSYRAKLLHGMDGVHFIHLKGSYDLIWSRISKRKGHYMKPEMLRSQFEALEEPIHALVMDVRLTPEEVVEKIIKSFQL